MIDRMELYPGIRFSAYTDSRFKQNCLSIQYVRKMDRAEAAMNALIPSVLLRGTKSARNLREITLRLDELYGASVSAVSRRAGDYQTTGFYVSLMDDRFALEGESVLKKTISFVKELLFDYPTRQGGFLPEFVEGEKTNQIAAIEAELNDKRVYAARQLLEEMCREDPFGIPRMGQPQDVAAITPQGLLQHYLRVRRESPVQLYYVGSGKPEEVAESLRDMFASEERAYMPLPEQTELKLSQGRDIREKMEVAQGKLCMGFYTPKTNRTEDFAAMQVTNGIFGGDVTSKLFQNVREKQSLCYSIASSYYSAKGVALVSAGIDFDKEDHTRQEILAQLESMRRGGISDAELLSAKEALISALRGVHDSPASIEGYYAAMELGGSGLTPQSHTQALEKVTREDVVRCAKALQLHSTYFLEGGNSDAADGV